VIVMPDTTPENKVAAVRSLGAEIVIVPPSERDTRAFELAAYLAGTTTGKHVAVLSGGSVDPRLLARVLAETDREEAVREH
jgi:threonine dehydratase